MGLLRPIAAAGAAAVLVAVPLAGATAAAEGGTPSITNTETVNAKLDASGKLDVARIYDQIAIEGSGTVSISNPVSTTGLRNLDGFSGFTVNNGAIDETVNVNSSFRQRAVSDFTKQLPVGVKITYLLDGQQISPSDLVGKSGRVEFKYRVENLTGQSQELTVKDGAGKDVTKPVTVYEPLAGSLDLTVPPGFVDVQPTGGGVAAGDGKGGTQMSFNLTLIPPLGDPVAEFGFTATVTNAVVPPASLTIVPVVVSSNPTITGAADSYKGGAATGGELTQGAQQIDANLLKLSAGAGQLLSGLLQLKDGASQLAAGLTGAAPGAQKLASGATQVSDGASQVSAGANKLAANTPALADGAAQVASGASELNSGIGQLQKGLDQLSAGISSLPVSVQASVNADPSYQLLMGTLTKIIAGIGTPADTGQTTLLGGLNNVQWGLRYPSSTTDCAVALAGGTPTRCGAMDAVQLISGLLATGANDVNTKLDPLAQALYFGAYGPPGPCPGSPTTIIPPAGATPVSACEALAAIHYGLVAPASPPSSLGGVATQAKAASDALASVYGQVDTQLIPGIGAIKKALYNTPCNPAQTNPTASDYCGISQALGLVQGGIPQLVSGIADSIAKQLSAGVGTAPPPAGCDPTKTLTCAAAALDAGSAQLASGSAQVAAGASQVNSGTQQLASGSSQVAAGASQVAGGADQLSSGLTDAANGASQIEAGLGQAADAVPQIRDGAKQLSTEGTQKLIAAGNSTALDFGEKYAVIQASAARTADGGLPYGAPTNATVKSAAYSIDIAGASGESSKNTSRGVAALLIGAGAAGAAMIVGRRFAL